MTITTNERDQIIKLTIGMFNAAPGATYLNTITGIFESNGHSMAGLAQALSGTAAFQAMYSTFQTAPEFAASFLAKLGLQSNQTAIDFVTNQVNAGVNKGEIIRNAIAILEKIDPAVGGQIGAAASALANKAAVALYYSVDKAATVTDLSVLQALIAAVTSDAATVATAKASIDGGVTGSTTPAAVVVGSTYVLTNALGESIVGTAGDDIFSASVSATNSATDATLNAGDAIDGGTGNDTLNLLVGSALGTLAAGVTIKNVETVVIDVSSFSPNPFATVLKSSFYDGINKLVQANNTLGGSFSTMTVDSGVTAVIKSTGVDATAAVGSVSVIPSATQTVLNIGLDGVKGGGAISLGGSSVLDVLNLSGSFTSGTETLSGSTILKTLNVAMTSGANLAVSSLTGLTKIDGSSSTGALTMSNLGLTSLTSLKGGSGADSLTAYMGLTSGTALAVDAGAGNDIVTIIGGTPGTGSNTVTLGAGKDTLVIAFGALANIPVSATASTIQAKIVTVTDFNTSEDTLNLAGLGVALTSGQLATVAAASDLLAATKLVEGIVGGMGRGVFNFGGDAYIFVSDALSGLNSTDGLIKLTGVDATQFTNAQNGNLVL